MRVIVTGGAGFIGSHLVDRLVSLGFEVIVIDDESATTHDQFYYNDSATYYKIDVADYIGIRPLFEDVEYVFHLAAESRIQPTIENPLLCLLTNAHGTAAVLQSAREAKCKKVMYSSTSSTYGLKNKPPLNENMPEDCLNPYSVTKYTGEKLCKIYTELFDLKTVTFRYFNVYGPREPIKGPYAPVVGLFLRQKAAGEPLTIVGDGLQRRDFTHVDDIVEANLRAIKYRGKLHGHAFNVGTGTNHSVLDLAKMISNTIKFIPKRPGEATETLADMTRMETEFRWKPSKNIEDYIAERLK